MNLIPKSLKINSLVQNGEYNFHKIEKWREHEHAFSVKNQKQRKILLQRCFHIHQEDSYGTREKLHNRRWAS